MASGHVTVEEGGRSLVRLLLADQQRLTAVERFGQKHDEDALPALARYYRDLIPLSEPREGEQYVFEVDLDACTGCKACVAGCHSLNGLDEGEVWRRVGVVEGRDGDGDGISRTVTSACHHCAEPACLQGCPVKAYEKDSVTGIVRHLDDQCIGCQYCILKCPYDVPQYSAARGIVRKCDMCHGRLSAGEAPACVQACPTGAIRIGVATRASVVARGARGEFLPGAPGPETTLPSTMYSSASPLPVGLRAADDHRLRVEAAHAPLVFMLVLTQAAVGLGAAHAGLAWLAPDALGAGAGLRLAVAATALGVEGIGVTTLHLGHPMYAFRAFLGLRTSWLSRETVVFGAFAPLLVLHALALSTPGLVRFAPAALGASLLAGALAVGCSVMVYVDTRRASWSLAATTQSFVATGAVLGAAGAALAVSLAGHLGAARGLLAVAGVVALLGLAAEASRLRGPHADPALARAQLVRTGPLKGMTAARFSLGALGATAALLAGISGLLDARLVAAVVGALAAGEVLERALFFRAVTAPRMPGSPG